MRGLLDGEPDFFVTQLLPHIFNDNSAHQRPDKFKCDTGIFAAGSTITNLFSPRLASDAPTKLMSGP